MSQLDDKYIGRLAYYLDLWGNNIITNQELISILDHPDEHLLSEDEKAIKYVIE